MDIKKGVGVRLHRGTPWGWGQALQAPAELEAVGDHGDTSPRMGLPRGINPPHPAHLHPLWLWDDSPHRHLCPTGCGAHGWIPKLPER